MERCKHSFHTIFSPVDGVWEEWGPVESCTVSCGRGGMGWRHRDCSAQQYGGRQTCPVGSTSSENIDCPIVLCPSKYLDYPRYNQWVARLVDTLYWLNT